MRHGTMMSGYYDPMFVTLSVFIAILSAYAALDLTSRVMTSRRRSVRLAWLGGGAIAMGIGIWSMHYIGMLGFRMSMPVLYDWPTVLLSMTAAVLASGIALSIATRRRMGVTATAIGSLFMGGGIAAMHYIGMFAMRMPAVRVYSTPLVLASIFSAVVIAFVALRLTFAYRGVSKTWTWGKGLTALLMGLAIPVMHYLGMAAVGFVPGPLNPRNLRHAVSISDLGAMSIALVSIVMLFLVFFSAMLDRRFTIHALEMEVSEERYRKIISSAFDAFIGITADGTIIDWNAQAEMTFGWKASSAIGMSIHKMIELGSTAEKERGFRNLLASGDGLQGRVEVQAHHQAGLLFPAEMAISAITVGAHTIFAAFVHDVTERKLAERTAQEARANAEAANSAKSEFLANMSHEIRTPLNGIIGMTDLALETELTREQREYLSTVKFSADSLLTVINDILDFSKIEAGKVDLEEISFDLRDCMESTLRSLALRADEKGLELLCDISPDVPETVMGDPSRLRQIVVNLIGNAIKFTAEGEVTFSVSLDDAMDNAGKLHFTISDTGIGIPANKVDAIFDSFSQADSSTTRQYGGTGLGLTITRRLLELMAGRIWIESQVGEGSHFHFVVPLKQGVPPERSTQQSSSFPVLLAGVKTLVVDDNKTNRRILSGLLDRWQMRPTAVADGEGALAALREATVSADPYRLILTDMHMPKMDGLMLVEHIRANTQLAPATVLMLSSGGHRGDAARCQELGVAAYLLKPVRQTELQAAIARALDANAALGTSTMITKNSLQAERPPHQTLRILLAEDNEVNQKLAVRLLEKRGHSVKVANNGRQAVEALAAAAFDLIFMDVHMPEMDGLEATRNIREGEAGTGRRQPIVAMTALVMKGDRERCLDADMDDYLSKPIRSQELDDILDRYSVLKEASLNSGAEISNRVEEQTATDVTSTADEQTLHVEELLERVDGDREFVAELSGMFREDYPKHLATMRACLDQGDAEGLKRSSHALKGALSNLGALRGAALAGSLEQSAAEGTTAGAISSLVELEHELPRVVVALAELCTEQVL